MMHLGHFWNAVPSTASLVWRRLTFSKLTIAYFTFTLIHFIIQLAFQAKALTINASAADFLTGIVLQGHATSDSLSLLRGDVIYMCAWVPDNLDTASCHVVWDATRNSSLQASQKSGSDVPYNPGGMSSVPVPQMPSKPSSTTKATAASGASSLPSITVAQATSSLRSSFNPSQTVAAFVLPSATPSTSSMRTDDDSDREQDKREIPIKNGLVFREYDQIEVNVSGIAFPNRAATLDQQCIWALNWPVSELRNTKREDIVFIAFHFWLLGMSFAALLNESIPHILASLLTHALATAWGAFQIANTMEFHSAFSRVITNGACDGVSLLPDYWQGRGSAEIASLALNVFGLLVSGTLTWKLVKLFGWQTFKRVGASLTINRLYKIVLVLSILIQMGFFFMAVAVSLWIDQLLNSPIGDLASFQTLYKATSITTLVFLTPWFLTGWFAVRRELRLPMFFFLFFSTVYLAGWGVMFFATTFKWAFVTWRFFSVMASSSVILTVASLALGIVCRYNFGKGLSRYLSGQDDLLEDDPNHSGNSDLEKVGFPSSEKPVPTYNGYVPAIPAPAPAFASTRGPRFFNKVTEPFETGLIHPHHAPVGRKTSSIQSKTTIARSNSHSSDKSIGSFYSYSEPGHSRNNSQAKERWVIE